MPHTLAQLEAFVSSEHYDATTAGLIALGVPELPRLKGEQIAPGITRIRGNLCNVHGRYGPCDKAASGGKKPGKGRKPAKAAKPKQTPEQRAAGRDTEQQANRAAVFSKLGLFEDATAALADLRDGKPVTDDGGLVKMGMAEQAGDGSFRLTPTGRALMAAANAGDVGRARDIVSRGTDAQGKRTERTTAQQTRQEAARQRQIEVATRRQAAAAERAKRQQERATRKPEKASTSGGGGEKKPEKPSVERPRRAAPAKRVRRNSAPSIGSVASSAPKKRPSPSPPKAVQPAKAPSKQIAPALQESVQALSDGKELSEQDTQSLIRNGLAKLNKDGTLILTAAGMRATTKAQTAQDRAMFAKMGGGSGGGGGGGKSGGSGGLWSKGADGKRAPTVGQRRTLVNRANTARRNLHREAQKYDAIRAAAPKGSAEHKRATQNLRRIGTDLRRIDSRMGNMPEPRTNKEYSFQVFKDASGRYRWVAQSSTAFQDRDKEIVSTKALADDCQFADETGTYGPLRWWHTPGLDLGECDFNAMHGRVLIESGTFKSEQIALKVAQAAPQLEISLGFLHLPTEPDASGVFHHIRRFERSLVPRGKASNRFTAFRVKEIPMLDATKVAALKTLGFSDDDITSLQTQAAATEKSADAQQVAYKADGSPVTELPDVVINGVTYKALPPSPPTAADAVVEEDAIGEMPVEEEAVGGLTLSPEDLAAITEVFQTGLAQVMGALDLEKKVAGHVQGLMQPYQQAQATKDVTDAEKAEQIGQLQAALKDTQDKLNELLGLQPAVKAERATESTTTTINPWIPQDQQLLQAIKHQVSPDEQFAFGDLVENLFGNQTPGQA